MNLIRYFFRTFFSIAAILALSAMFNFAYLANCEPFDVGLESAEFVPLVSDESAGDAAPLALQESEVERVPPVAA